MRTLKGENVLITGGAGFIGSFLAERIFKENPAKVVVQDNLFLGKKRNMINLLKLKNFKFYKSSTANYNAVKNIIEKEKISVVFNLAVIPLPTSLEKPEWTFDENVKMTLNLCKLARLKKFKTLVHFSSSEVYGTALSELIDENHPLIPHTSYAASKAAADHIVTSYHYCFGIDAFTVRPFNNYGPRQNEKSYAGVIPLTIGRILKGESPVITGTGSQTRDFTFVRDTADSVVKLYSAENTAGKAFNIATDNEITIKELITKIMKIMKCDKEIIYKEKRPGDLQKHHADIALLKKTIKQSNPTDFEEGLIETINWYIENGEFSDNG